MCFLFIFVGKATWNCRKCCELVIDVTLKWTVYPWAVFYDCINCYPIRYHGKSSPTGLPWIQAVQRGDQRGSVWTGEQDRQPRNLVQAKHNGWHSFGHANFRLNLSQILKKLQYICTCVHVYRYYDLQALITIHECFCLIYIHNFVYKVVLSTYRV